ncbi:hypothetical protein ACIQZG_14780 [Lysinibacillus sp. NPDC096418]|uniref:hypothetical protein n=1 Tax=Lysinibacillus sp. NPDC096418 TaxID=3364138 RepID=UPI0037F25EC1
MFITLGILAISALIIYFEIPKLIKKNDTKTIWTFSILLFLGTTLSIAKGLNANIPNPLDWITALFKPIADLLKTLLKF